LDFFSTNHVDSNVLLQWEPLLGEIDLDTINLIQLRLCGSNPFAFSASLPWDTVDKMTFSEAIEWLEKVANENDRIQDVLKGK
jgi:hypothetical protein